MLYKTRELLEAALEGYCRLNGYAFHNQDVEANTFIFAHTFQPGNGNLSGFNVIAGAFNMTKDEQYMTVCDNYPNDFNGETYVYLDKVDYTGTIEGSEERSISRKLIYLLNGRGAGVLERASQPQQPITEETTTNNTTNNGSSTHKTKKQMEKIIFSESLINRLTAAKDNGSEIATIILAERKKKHSEAIPNSIANNFDTVLRKNGGVPFELVISCCNKKDTEANPNHGNPQFPYLPENRSRISTSSFATLFDAAKKAIDSWDSAKQDYEWKLFNETMLIGEKITFRVGTTLQDIEFAYDKDNYLPTRNEDTLWNSCMSHSGKPKVAAQFYVLFAGAKILIGQTASGQVVSRAILWDGVKDLTAECGSNIAPVDKFIDRVYVTHSHLYKRMHAEAYKLGYRFRKYRNDYSSQTQFYDMKDDCRTDRTVYLTVPVNKWHKGGAPYLDTMVWVSAKKDDAGNTQLYLSNYSTSKFGTALYNLQTTDGYGSRYGNICPVCGTIHTNSTYLCRDCNRKMSVTLFDGNTSYKNLVLVDGVGYPREMVKRGKLTKIAQLSMCVRRIGEVMA